MGIITEIEGDIFDVPLNSVIIQACNAQGVWGKGVAMDFKRNFPLAFSAYRGACTKPSSKKSLVDHQRSLVGTCLLTSVGHDLEQAIPKGSYYHVVSLITSYGYGNRSRSPIAEILQNTTSALRALKAELEKVKENGLPVDKLYAVRINSGLFRVPWEETKKLLEEGEVDLTIVRPPTDNLVIVANESSSSERKTDGEVLAGKKRAKGDFYEANAKAQKTT